jgi:hypothetical protein
MYLVGCQNVRQITWKEKTTANLKNRKDEGEEKFPHHTFKTGIYFHKHQQESLEISLSELWQDFLCK